MTAERLAGPGTGWEAAAGRLAARLRPVLVGISSGRGGGSGTVWGADGLIITNAHVAGKGEVEVCTGDGRRLRGTVTAADEGRDLAAVRVASSAGLEPALVRPAAGLRAGELLFAMGNPWGERGTVTAGVYAGSRHGAGEESPGAIFADLRLAPGNSGGPLADAAGRVVGVNAMVSGGLAVSIPSESVAAFLEENAAPAGTLGVTLTPILLRGGSGAGSLRGAEGALLVTGVARGSAADEAGILPGDLLVGLDGAGPGVAGLTGRLRRMLAGEPLDVQLLRAGQPARLVARPVAQA